VCLGVGEFFGRKIEEESVEERCRFLLTIHKSELAVFVMF